MSKRPARAAILLVLALLLGACGAGGSHASDATSGRIRVIASFYPLADAVARVGGDRVAVTNLTPVGVEPHDIELTSREVDALQDADLVVYLGKDFQPAVAEIASRRDKGRVDVLDGIAVDNDGAAVDPHFWLDPTMMAKAVGEIVDALSSASPRNAAAFRANAQRYTDALHGLDTQFSDGLARCERHEIVTAHAAFFYLARRYGLTQRAVAGLSPESEPDAERLASLTDEIKAKRITTVFYEELVSPKVAEALAREAGVQTAVLSPIEGLTKKELDAGKDYVAVMRDNLAALRKALACR